MKKNLAQVHREPAGRHELPDGHGIRVGPGTIQVSARTSTGWQWFDVASNAEACDALGIYALNADIVALTTYELPDGHDLRVGPDMVEVQVRGSRRIDVELRGKWLQVATTAEACEVLADLAREAAKFGPAEEPEDTTEWKMVGADGRPLDDTMTFVASTEDEARDMARRTGNLPRTPVRFVPKKQRQGDGLAEGAVGAALGALVLGPIGLVMGGAVGALLGAGAPAPPADGAASRCLPAVRAAEGTPARWQEDDHRSVTYDQDHWIMAFVDRILAMLVYVDPATIIGFTMGGTTMNPSRPWRCLTKRRGASGRPGSTPAATATSSASGRPVVPGPSGATRALPGQAAAPPPATCLADGAPALRCASAP